MPGSVTVRWARALATPKSSTFTRPSKPTIRLCGDKSRCTSRSGAPSSPFARCAACSPCSACMTMATVMAGAGPRRLQQPVEVHPAHQLHHQVVGALGLAEVVEGDEVGVGQPQADARLVQELLHDVRVRGQVRQNPLERHQPAEPLRAPRARHQHLRHAPGAQRRHQLVAADAPARPRQWIVLGGQLVQPLQHVAAIGERQEGQHRVVELIARWPPPASSPAGRRRRSAPPPPAPGCPAPAGRAPAERRRASAHPPGREGPSSSRPRRRPRRAGPAPG